ncbi:hypothetical protein [Methanosarcina barkeri]|uniref:hypothetical protein n=1 Tax=Methanosarcina barkeri TaxID=2208 RepID=UPI000B2B3747|nr:hypothetical protein [Methanosarcina barkeri]
MQASLFEIRQDIQKDYKEDYRQSLIDWIRSSEIPPVSSSKGRFKPEIGRLNLK